MSAIHLRTASGNAACGRLLIDPRYGTPTPDYAAKATTDEPDSATCSLCRAHAQKEAS